MFADGFMNTVHRTEEIDYFPSRNNATVDDAVRGPAWSQETLQGERRKEMIHKENNFQQVPSAFGVASHCNDVIWSCRTQQRG